MAKESDVATYGLPKQWRVTHRCWWLISNTLFHLGLIHYRNPLCALGVWSWLNYIPHVAPTWIRSSTKPRCVGGYSLISEYIYIYIYISIIHIYIYTNMWYYIYTIYIHVIVILGMDHQPAFSVAISMAQVQTLGGHRREQLVRRWHARGPSDFSPAVLTERDPTVRGPGTCMRWIYGHTHTRWGPQDSVQLVYKWLNSMVYGRYNYS